MFISYVPKSSLANSENGSYFSWSGSEFGNQSTNFAGGDQHTFTTTGVIANMRIRARCFDAESASTQLGLNTVSLTGMAGNDNETRWYEGEASSLNGLNTISIWSAIADGFTIYDVEAIKGGDIECGRQPSNFKPKSMGSQVKSLSGKPYSVLYDYEKSHQVKTVPLEVTAADLAQWREFAHSVAASEYFWLDLDGTKANPVDAKQVYMLKDSFEEIWLGPAHREFAFTAIEL